ncbi:MAG: hypothetical protein ACRDY2_13125 [Acidimicrobiales bacterium]
MRTMAVLPSAWAILEAALRQRRPVQLTYHGRQRSLCPHALGWKNNKAMLLAYQTAGSSPSEAIAADPRRGWRNLFVDDIEAVGLAEPATPWETADNYNPSHPFNSIDQLSVAITSEPQGPP